MAIDTTPAPAAIQPDPELISRIEKPLAEAWAEAEKIAADPRLNDETRRSDINLKFSLGEAYVKSVYDVDVVDLDARIAKRTIESRQAFSPPAAEAPLLSITKQMVEAETSRMKNGGELINFWNIALENKDLPTLRILLHFHPVLKGRDDQRKSVELGAFIPKDIIEKTREMFLTDAQRKARAELEQLKVDRVAFERAKNKAMTRLTAGFDISKDGKLASRDRILLHKVLG